MVVAAVENDWLVMAAKELLWVAVEARAGKGKAWRLPCMATRRDEGERMGEVIWSIRSSEA